LKGSNLINDLTPENRDDRHHVEVLNKVSSKFNRKDILILTSVT